MGGFRVALFFHFIDKFDMPEFFNQHYSLNPKPEILSGALSNLRVDAPVETQFVMNDSNLSRSLVRLDETVTRMSTLLVRLEGALSPVMIESVPTEATESETQVRSSQNLSLRTSMIIDANNRLESKIAFLEGLISRLDV